MILEFLESLPNALKFSVVGGSAFIIDLILTFFLKDVIKVKPILSNSIGFVTGILLRFFGNRYWTFHQDSMDDFWQDFFQYVGIESAGLLIVNFAVWQLAQKRKMVSFFWAKVIGMSVFYLYNYSMNAVVTFNRGVFD